GTFSVGIPIEDPERKVLRLAGESYPGPIGEALDKIYVVRFLDHARLRLPRFEGDLMVEARCLTSPEDHQWLTGRGEWGGAIVLISTLHLEFAESSSVSFGPLRNIWPGAMENAPFAQYGRHSAVDKKQLVVMEPASKPLYIADRGARFIAV